MHDALSRGDVLLAGLFFLSAALYGSVGHAGASAYLAAMALVGTPAATMKPTALLLNLFVAAVVSAKFARAGHFSWRLFWPFALAAAPAAYLGGLIQLPDLYYKPLVGLALAVAAGRLWLLPAAGQAEPAPKAPPLPLALIAGAAVGLLAGLTGTGGGIFLSPLLVFCGWATLKQASGTAAVFILINSLAGLIGWLSASVSQFGDANPMAEAPRVIEKLAGLPAAMPLWIIAVLAGGWVGSEFGVRRLATPTLRRLLAAVLLIAVAKLLLKA